MPETKPAALRASVALAGACVALASCSGATTEPKPTALLSTSVVAEVEFRALASDFAHALRTERIAMEPRLASFRQRHENDRLAGPAAVLLAWIAMEKAAEKGAEPGALHAAEVRARVVAKDAGTGTVGDIARTVEGASLRRQGRPQEALDRLSPLVSKLIDAWARALLNEEVVESAVEAGRWERALELMGVWLREAGPEERATVQAHLAGSLEHVPAPDLDRWLGRARGIELGQAAEEELQIRRLVAQRLAMVARDQKDAALAARLLSTSGALLGDQGDAIAQLASGASRARVEAHTVGLLLSLRSDETRRRGADVAAGVAFGLGLPGSAARLVSRDDHGSADRIEEALAALSADGASIVIAGSDEQEATAAAAFAEAHQIPVILLRRPARSPADARFAFVVGVDPDELEGALVAALAARGAAPLAVLADEPIRPRAPRPEVAVVRGCSEVSASWKPLGVGGVVLSAPPDCARAAIAAAAPLRLRFAAGFEADPAPLPAGSLVASAGLFPIAGGAAPAVLSAWLKDHPGPPDLWAALGRDAAVLAWAGVQALPAQGTEDPHEVAVRRMSAAQALAGAQADLWTTDAKGFAGSRVLPRVLTVREKR